MFKKIITFLKKKPKKLHHTTVPSHQNPHQVLNMPKVYFSPGEDCADAIIRVLKNAKHSIDICVFTISDDKISKEIVECHHRKIKIRILTDNDKLKDAGSDIDRLAKAGIMVRVDTTTAHMHHKFMIVDNAILVNGSYNWTKSAALSNQENIIVSNEQGLLAAFRQQFDKMWKTMEVYN